LGAVRRVSVVRAHDAQHPTSDIPALSFIKP